MVTAARGCGGDGPYNRAMDAVAAPQEPRREEEPAAGLRASGGGTAPPPDYPRPEIALAPPHLQENEEPDMSRLRMAIDALNAQFRRERG